MTSPENQTVQRLETYYPFDADIAVNVAEAAAYYENYSFEALADAHGITGGPNKVAIQGIKSPLEYYAIHPVRPYDFEPKNVRAYFAPMATPADENMAMRAMRLFQADSTRSLYVFGAPAALGIKTNHVAAENLPGIYEGDFRPIVTPAIQHLRDRGVENVQVLGYSYGADIAATAAKVAADYDIVSSQGVMVESAATQARSVSGLLLDFMKSGKELKTYIAQAESVAYAEARKLSNTGMLRYLGGLARPENLVIAHALANDTFGARVSAAIEAQSDFRAAIGWGTASELTNDMDMQSLSIALRHKHDGYRQVVPMQFEGMHHAGGDDIDLHAAIMLQGLRETT